MTDIFNAYKTQQSHINNAFSETTSVHSLDSNTSLMSNWSYVSAPRSLVPSEMYEANQRLAPAGDASVASSVMNEDLLAMFPLQYFTKRSY